MRCFLWWVLAFAWPAMGAADGEPGPLHLEDGWIRDSSHRAVVLRGVVTITMNNDGRPMAMTGADYDRIRAWGFNVQQIRLEACRLGLLPPCMSLAPGYLDKLEAWVAMGAERGIYSIFKATTYDIPGLGFQDQFKPGAWNRFWDTGSGWQDQFQAGWRRVWERFKDNPAVIGYDILNECTPGSNTPGFIRHHLFPFYRRMYTALRKLDGAHLFFFQPSLRADDELEPLGGAGVVFAPHFYPLVGRPEATYRRLLDDGRKVNAPVLIGEYGLPNTPFRAGATIIPAGTPERDRGDALLFDQTAMSTIKTWYTSVGNWALLTPEGEEQPRLRYFSRPYPQRTAGTPKSFSFDFDTGQWRYEWESGPAVQAPTVIYVPLARHYPNGFRIAAGDVRLETDRAAKAGLVVTGGPREAGAAFRYDFASQTLTVDAAARVNAIAIGPRP